jgi:hypothetical protein
MRICFGNAIMLTIHDFAITNQSKGGYSKKQKHNNQLKCGLVDAIVSGAIIATSIGSVSLSSSSFRFSN